MEKESIKYYSQSKKVGWASFFLNCSSLIVFSYFAYYLKNELHISFSSLGLLDGCVDFLSYVMRLCSGAFSDFLLNRKLFFLLGVAMVVLAKPFEAIFRSFGPMFCTKILERIGNGLQATPRDALLTDYSDEYNEQTRAKIFGTRQVLASMGSLTGSVLACLLLWRLGDFQLVFWCSVPFGLVAILIIIFGVKNKYDKKQLQTVEKEKKNEMVFKSSDLKKLPSSYWRFLLITFFYYVPKVSDSMCLLYAIGSKEVPLYCMPLFFVFFHIGASLGTFLLSRRQRDFSKDYTVLKWSLILFVSGVAILTSRESILIGMMCLGAFSGISNGLLPAYISEMLPHGLRGTGHGIFNFTCAVALLLGGITFGMISDKFGQCTALCWSFFLGLCVLGLVFAYDRNKKIDNW